MNAALTNAKGRWASILTLIFVAALVGAACGGGSDGDDAADDPGTAATRDERESDDEAAPADQSEQAQAQAQSQSQSQSQAQAQAQAQAEEQSTPSRSPATAPSGDLRLAFSSPLTLDPALTTSVDSARFVVEIFGGLLSLDQDLRIIPDLAETLPEFTENADGTVTYTFHLRRDALFHNGRRVMADDVKWSIERHAHPDTFSPTAPDFLNDILGAVDYMRGRADEISGIQVVDDNTIQITIDAPKPYFLFKLTYPTSFVVDRQQVENDPRNWASQPNGTGPFTLVEWNLGEGMVLERWDRYHLELAIIERVEVRFAGGGLTQYENNEVDIADVGTNDIERARDPNSDLNAEFVSRNELSIFYVGFNTQQPPFDDRDVRRALAMAIDKQTIADVVLQSIAPVANGVIPPGLAAFDEAYGGLPFDPELAKETLDASSYAGTPFLENIRITVPGAGATPGNVIVAIQDMWRENLGLDIEIQQVEAANFFSELDQGLYQAFSLGWILDYPDPENIIDLLFHSSSLQNNPAYQSDELDALVEEARVELDAERRIELYREAERVIVEDAPWVPLFFGTANQVVKPYVTGYLPPRSIIPHLRYIGLEQ
ncbi:MAG: oligopeptide transport system substrate-binding protein [Chloroflexi bacterium]|nr:MAG: oligopeptide transport system substrate-binding protein [Chloroflexota bacterium]